MTKEEAITTLSDIRSEYNCFSHVEGGRYHALSMGIEALKEQKHGQWIRSVDELGEAWMCSECLEEFFPADGMDEFICYIHYCPNCGADMRQKEVN